MSENMVDNLIKERYCIGDERSWDDICKRVSKYIASDENYENAYYNMLFSKDFLPNSPTLMNAGTATPMLSACFYLPISDCISNNKSGIFDQVRNAALIFKFGGGVGLNFSQLRPAGSKVRSTNGVSSGVISFMRNFNTMTETIKQGGKRRGALMGCLDIDHPEIEDFISCKNKEGDLSNFNISVKLTDKYLNDPTTIHTPNRDPSYFYPLGGIIDGIYKNGEPGILFKDTIERSNPRPDLGELNPNPSLRKGTRILTSNGIIKIDNLENKSFSVPSLSSSKSTAICKLSGHNKQLYEIELNTHIKYYATKEHKWIVIDNGKYIKKTTNMLSNGDILPLSSYTNDMNYGTMGTYNEGFLIGWNLGDGCVTTRKDNNKQQYNFTFSQEDIDNGIYDKIKYIINDICKSNINGCVRENKYTNNTFIEINSSNDELNILFNKFNMNITKNNGISDIIFEQTTNEFRKGLIDGLFSSDGWVIDNENYGWVAFKSKHEKLLTDIIELLGFYGIRSLKQSETTSNVTFPNGKNYNKSYTSHILIIPKQSAIQFRNIFSLSHYKKQSKLNNLKLKNKTNNAQIKIKSVKLTDLFEDVWDLTVNDDSHSFRLSQCYTGNCAEALLYDFESCNLGSINWSNIFLPNVNSPIWKDHIDWNKYEYTIRKAVHFLNNVIDKNQYPLPEIEEASKLTRKIGLGGMGLHDLLLKLNVPYESDIAFEIGRELELFMKKIAKIESEKNNFKNTSLTTIAPTGTISIIANVSSGIEPVFNWVITRKDSLGEHYVVHPIFNVELEKDLTQLEFIASPISCDGKEYRTISDLKAAIIEHCHKRGTIQDIGCLSADFKKLFKNAMDIDWKHHIKMQAEFQNNGVDMSISKTINLPNNATKEDIKNAIFMAWKLGCKGLTIYRNGSRENEVLNLKKDDTPKPFADIKQEHKRPRCLFGATYKVQSGCGKLFVTINERNGKPYEVIIQSGGSGGCEAGNQALGRAISLALRTGGDIRNIIKQLCKVKCPAALRNPRSEGKSCSDIIGKLIEEYIPDADEDEIETALITYEICPECRKKTLIREAGCKVCHACGYSKCG
jgi:ribonucleoside-diphosphate reductase alpha chain